MRHETIAASPRASIFPREGFDAARRRAAREPIAFRHFIALPAARALLRRGAPVAIGGRAFDLLLALLRQRGTIVPKEEIMRQVWPSTLVDEGNLRFQMAMLRKALGADRDLIKTVNGRGYLLVDEVGPAEMRGWALPPIRLALPVNRPADAGTLRMVESPRL